MPRSGIAGSYGKSMFRFFKDPPYLIVDFPGGSDGKASVYGHLSCFHVLAIVNSAAMNNGIHASFSILVSSGCMPRSVIAGSYGGFIPFKESLYHLP